MNSPQAILHVLVVVGCMFIYTHALNDKEIETIKHLVDTELIKRELDLLTENKEPENVIVHPLGGRMKPSKKPIKTTATEPTPPTSTKTTTATPHPDEGLQGSIDNCIDIYDTQKCEELISGGMDCNKDDMHLYCEKSCRFCGNHRYPFDCSTSKYGCCSDNLTPRTDPWGEKCPKCEDKAPELCEPHINDCNEIGMVGNWMRANCMKTCGGCIPKAESAVIEKKPCEDDKNHKAFCKNWEKNGLCGLLKDFMNEHCRKTCSLCDS